MELARTDYRFLNILYEKDRKTFFHSMTLGELMEITGNARTSAYRKMMNMKKLGYVESGCKAVNAKTFYITEKGIEIIKNGGMLE